MLLFLLSVNYTDIEKEQKKGEEEKNLLAGTNVLDIQLMPQVHREIALHYFRTASTPM